MNSENTILEGVKNPYPSQEIDVLSASFTTDLCLGRKAKAIPKKNSESLYIVTRDYEVEYEYNSKNDRTVREGRFAVPAGMVTDLASVPKWLRWAYQRVGDHLEAAIAHDWLYCAWQLLRYYDENKEALPCAYYKKFAEEIFYRLLIDSDFHPLEAGVLKDAVDSHGSSHFNGRDYPIVDEQKPCSELAQKTTEIKDPYSDQKAKIKSPYPGQKTGIENPYPKQKVTIAKASYVQDLCFGRRKGANTERNAHSRYMVTQDYKVKYQLKGEKDWHFVTVPAGMYTNLAMGPARAEGSWEKVGKHLEAAIVHDWLYCAWKIFPAHDKDKGKQYPPDYYKEFADDLLLCLLEAAKYNEEDRNEFYESVWKYGEYSFRKQKRYPIIENKKRLC